MSNPYGDEPYTTAWQQGFDHGTQNPSDTDPQPPDFSSWGYDEDVTGYIGQVWREGALAGREASSGGGGGGGAEGDVVTLPEDVAHELTHLRESYPESFAILDAGDAETYLRNVVGVEYIPSEGDDEDLPVA